MYALIISPTLLPFLKLMAHHHNEHFHKEEKVKWCEISKNQQSEVRPENVMMAGVGQLIATHAWYS